MHGDQLYHHLTHMERRLMTKIDELVAAEGNVAAKVDALLAAYNSGKDLAAHPAVAAAAATDADLQAVIDKLNADSAKVDAALAPPAEQPAAQPAEPAPVVEPAPQA